MNKVSIKLNVLENKKDFDSLFSVINKSAIIPILEDIRVVKNGSLKFMATDLENFITIEHESKSEDEFDFCIESSKVKSIFKGSLTDEIIIDGNEDKVVLNSGEFKVNIKLDKSPDFPKCHVSDEFISERIKSKGLSILLEQAVTFLSNDDLRPAMTGINLVDWNGQIFVVATDAHRIFYKPFMQTTEKLKGLSIVIRNKSARLFLSMFKDEDVDIKIEKDKFVTLIGNKKELVCRLVEAKYPDFQKVFPICILNFSMQRKQLNSFIKIAKNFTDKYTNAIRLKVKDDSITFSGGDKFGDQEFDYKLPIYNLSNKYLEFYFSVNINFLKQAININKKDEYVYIEHTTESTKGFVIDKCLLMMPLMTNE